MHSLGIEECYSSALGTLSYPKFKRGSGELVAPNHHTMMTSFGPMTLRILLLAALAVGETAALAPAAAGRATTQNFRSRPPMALFGRPGPENWMRRSAARPHSTRSSPPAALFGLPSPESPERRILALEKKISEQSQLLKAARDASREAEKGLLSLPMLMGRLERAETSVRDLREKLAAAVKARNEAEAAARTAGRTSSQAEKLARERAAGQERTAAALEAAEKKVVELTASALEAQEFAEAAREALRIGAAELKAEADAAVAAARAEVSELPAKVQAAVATRAVAMARAETAEAATAKLAFKATALELELAATREAAAAAEVEMCARLESALSAAEPELRELLSKARGECAQLRAELSASRRDAEADVAAARKDAAGAAHGTQLAATAAAEARALTVAVATQATVSQLRAELGTVREEAREAAQRGSAAAGRVEVVEVRAGSLSSERTGAELRHHDAAERVAALEALLQEEKAAFEARGVELERRVTEAEEARLDGERVLTKLGRERSDLEAEVAQMKVCSSSKQHAATQARRIHSSLLSPPLSLEPAVVGRSASRWKRA